MSGIEFNVTPPEVVLNKFRAPHEDLVEAAGELLCQAVASKNNQSAWAKKVYGSPDLAYKAMTALNKLINKGEWAGGDHRLMITVDGAALYFCAMPKEKIRRKAGAGLTRRESGEEREGHSASGGDEAPAEDMGWRTRSACKTCHKSFGSRFELGKHYQANPSHRIVK